jgi:phosphoenolpyruvate-protein phosphotransferase (PTS system enzyme I)
MQTKKGIPVSPGIAIAPAMVLDGEDQPIPRRTVAPDQVPKELTRLDDALKASTTEVLELKDKTTARVGPELAAIFGFHVGMLTDKTLVGEVRSAIENQRVTAEFAVYSVLKAMGKKFLQAESRYMRERVTDVWDLERRILRHLIGKARDELGHLKHSAVIIAHDLTPSQTASLDRSKIKGIATDGGGLTSHTAILAHALGIPAIVGLEDITRAVNTGDMVVIDGQRGVVTIEPDAEQLMLSRKEADRRVALGDQLGEIRDLPAETKDGTQIHLHANIEFPSEIDQALNNGAKGIGLYRTEFLYLAAKTEPTEEEQYQTYLQAIKNLNGLPLTVRTLDLGADKMDHLHNTGNDPNERNPFLGCRSIRLCLQNLPLFKTQLRAILRASTTGPVRIMFPLISNIMELRQSRMILGDVMEDLEEQGIAYAENIPVGIMVEVPSVAIQAKTFCREVDFLSIGTNDLIQYTVAVDRGNERIASLYSGAHPAVILLIRDVVRAADKASVDISLCGEMASVPEYTMLLIGLGLRSLSITPPALPEVKQIIRAVSIDQCRRVARKAATFDSDREVANYLRDQLSKAIPGVFDGRSIGY